MEKVKVTQSNPPEVVLLLVGNEGVGKTTIIMKLIRSTSQSQGLPSAPLREKNLPEKISSPRMQTWRQSILEDGKLINLTLLDPVECKRGSDIDASYFRRSHAIIIMFDCSDQSTLFTVSIWHGYICRGAEKDTLVFVLGRNYDPKNSILKPEDVKRLSRTLGITRTFLLANTEPDVEDIFRTIIQHVMERKQMQEGVMEPRPPDFSPRESRWVNLKRSVRSGIHSVTNWVRPRCNAYRPLTQQEEMPSSENGGNADPQTSELSARSGFAFFFQTSLQTGVEENEESVKLFLPGPSTSGAASQPPGTQQHAGSSAHASVSPQGASRPVASTSLHQETSEVHEASTVTVEAEVPERKLRPRKQPKPLAQTETSEIQETQF